MPTAETIRVARRVREAFAPSGLTPLQAKLYSQRIRREMGREGLPTFEAGAVFTYLEDAIFLLDCALIEREGDPGGSWRMGVKRAAEILEWLSQPSLRPERSPLHLLSAAAFQVAAYPAMALGELQRVPNDDSESKILLQFLRADFPATLALIHDFWRLHLTSERTALPASSEFSIEIVRHSVMAIGAVCSYFKTGESQLVHRSLTKITNIAKSLLHSRDPYSYLLARLVGASCERFVETSLWPKLFQLSATSPPGAAKALVQFARSSFANKRALVWPAKLPESTGLRKIRLLSCARLQAPEKPPWRRSELFRAFSVLIPTPLLV
jgi:hypothetical protein